MTGLEGLPIGEVTGPAALVLVALMVITDKLVWHTRLKAAEKRADKWEQVALSSLGVAEKLTVHAEVATEVLTRLPDPAADAPAGTGSTT